MGRKSKMRTIRFEDVRREVETAWDISCDSASCEECVEMLGKKYDRWFAYPRGYISGDFSSGYLAIVDCDHLGCNFVCQSDINDHDEIEEIEGKIEINRKSRPPAKSGNVIEYVKVVK